MTNVPTGLNNFKTKVDDFDVSKLKNSPVDLKKLSDIINNEVVKIKVFNALQTKVNSLHNKTPDTTILIHINWYNTDKQNLEEKRKNR